MSRSSISQSIIPKWFHVTYRVESVDRDLVTFTETISNELAVTLREDRTTLRFVGEGKLAELLGAAGFGIDAQFGGWQWDPLLETSAEIITACS